VVRKYKVETRQGSRMSEGTGSDEAANQGEGREARIVRGRTSYDCTLRRDDGVSPTRGCYL